MTKKQEAIEYILAELQEKGIECNENDLQDFEITGDETDKELQDIVSECCEIDLEYRHDNEEFDEDQDEERAYYNEQGY